MNLKWDNVVIYIIIKILFAVFLNALNEVINLQYVFFILINSVN